MGTDRSIEFQGPCLCGRGTFRIDDCEVDHSWPTATPQWYESQINCAECSERFSLQKRGNRFVLVENTILREREQRKQTVADRANSILSDENVRAAIHQFEGMLNAQRSVAAVYRKLNEAGLAHCTEGTFRRHWRNAHVWLEQHAKPNALVQIFEAINAPTNQLKSMLIELNALEEHASQLAEPYGEPVHVL